MNKKYTIIGSIVSAAAVVAAIALPAFALTSAASVGLTATASGSVGGTGVRAALDAKVMTNITTRANQEITRRINALTALSTRVNAMARISAEDKSNLSVAIQSQISAMNTLQTKITADAAANDTTTLKTDVQSITSSYRIFALILPQGTIEAMADRALTISGTLSDLSAKFSTRISAAQAAGNNVVAAQASLSDMNTKTADANTQAQAAISEVASLTPDNGNATVMASNTAALKDAHSKILVAQQDFVSARADATAIVKALATYKVSTSASASTSASTSVQ